VFAVFLPRPAGAKGIDVGSFYYVEKMSSA